MSMTWHAVHDFLSKVDYFSMLFIFEVDNTAYSAGHLQNLNAHEKAKTFNNIDRKVTSGPPDGAFYIALNDSTFITMSEIMMTMQYFHLL